MKLPFSASLVFHAGQAACHIASKIACRAAWLITLLCSLSFVAFAQGSTTGRLVGTVLDEQGSAIANAQVGVKGNQAEGQYNVVTNKAIGLCPRSLRVHMT